MKTRILSIFLSVAAFMGLASCNDDNWNPGGDSSSEGSLSLSSIDVNVDADENVVSRADVSTDNFIVDILDKTTGAIEQTYIYGSMPEVITLPVGDYTVNVRSHEVKEAEWAAPYYVGSAAFSIEAGKITEIGKVLCKFASIKVTVRYTKELLGYLGDDARVRVNVNERGTLDYTPAETRAGYFEAVEGNTTLVAEFSATINGNAINEIKTFTGVGAGKHYIITFSVKNGSATVPDEYGGINPSGITIDAVIDKEDVGSDTTVEEDNTPGTTVRPGEEEWPDDPTPGPGPDQPGPDEPGDEPITFTTDLSLTSSNPVIDGKTYKVDIHADKGIENLVVDITSDNEGFIGSAGAMLPLNFDLAHIDPTEKNSTDLLLVDVFRESLFLPCNEEVLGKTDIPFNITELVPLLAGFPGTHTFTISVTDQEGNTRSTKLIFLAQ